MSERTRNLAVGLTVLVALAMLAGMITLFTVVPAMFKGGYIVHMLSDTTHELQAGFPVHFAGMRVGYISDVSFTDPTDPTKGVMFTAKIDRQIRLPGNTNVYVFTKGFVGSPYIELKSVGPAHVDPRTGKPLEFLPTDGSVPLRVIHLGSGMIPDELKDALQELRTGFAELGKLAKNLNDLLAPPPPATGPSDANAPAPTQPAAPDLRTTLAKLTQAMDGMAEMFGDKQNQANLKAALANLAKASEGAPELMDSLKSAVADARKTFDKAGGDFDHLTAKLMDSADKLAVLMTSLNKVAHKLQSSEGSAGKLLNDPKLYNNLLEVTVQLNGLLKEFRVLVQQWQERGMGVKLK
ncbi:MAG TPA: MlaD family protein [Phycisphaerae bacterium]|nr:MlaD family protein [Phycisphaerae bacterium]